MLAYRVLIRRKDEEIYLSYGNRIGYATGVY